MTVGITKKNIHGIMENQKKYIKKQTRKNNIVWRRKLDKFIDSIPDDTVIVGVDCHV